MAEEAQSSEAITPGINAEGTPNLEGVADPVVRREATRGGPHSIARRLLRAVAMLGASAQLVACGVSEGQVNDPAAFTINTGQAAENQARVIEQTFKGVSSTEVTLRPKLSSSDILGKHKEIWRRNSAELQGLNPFDSSMAFITVLTGREFPPEEPDKQWRAFAISSTSGESLVIGEVRSAPAQSLIDKDLLAPEDRDLEAVRLLVVSQKSTLATIRDQKGFSVFLEQVDTAKNYSADPSSLRSFHIASPSQTAANKPPTPAR